MEQHGFLRNDTGYQMQRGAYFIQVIEHADSTLSVLVHTPVGLHGMSPPLATVAEVLDWINRNVHHEE